ncbi:MAG: hypothetical protein ACJAWV_002448 [Flammeovirgaceae bacterium]|jgi:hypothetical protein
MILKFKLLGSSVDAWEAPLEPVLLLVFRVLTNSKNKLISSNLSFVIPFNQIHDRAYYFGLLFYISITQFSKKRIGGITKLKVSLIISMQ